MRRCLVVLIALAAACGGDGAGGGPLKVGIVSGNNQSVKAPVPQLPQPIVGRLVRLPSGSIVWMQRATDALLPAKAFAQTQVLSGAPVVGAVVCAAPVTGTTELTPIVPCTSTATDGTATFAFTHGTTAGVAEALVQGMQNGVVATYDTAKATVLPGAVTQYGGWSFNRDTLVTAGQVLDFSTFPLTAKDQYGNVVTTFEFTYQRFNRDPTLNDAATLASRLVTVRGGDTLIFAFADGVKAGGGIHVRVSP